VIRFDIDVGTHTGNARGMVAYRAAVAWGARLTTSTRRFSDAFGSILFFGLVLP
jgi:hypothetical protein